VYAAGLSLQQPRLIGFSDRLVVVSEAHGAALRELGLPHARTVTLPNFVPSKQFARSSAADQGRHALASGRIVEEKGFDTAVIAARRAGVPLVIAGEGPDEGRLRQLAAGSEVHFTGLLPPDALADLRREAAVVLVPSRCEEACPYSVLDAFAAGVPVLASDRGGLPELVGADAALDPEDHEAWAEALKALWDAPDKRRELGEGVLSRARDRLGEDRYYAGLIDVYAQTSAG
jgi:glycosyltransferase involved in cell wall biosynthesis